MEQNNKFRRYSSPNKDEKKYSENRQPYQRRTYYNNNRQQNNNQHKINHDHFSCSHAHNHTFLEELWCHIPFSIFSLIISFLFVSLFFYVVQPLGNQFLQIACHNLFHLTHYIHIFLAATNVTLWTFMFATRYKLISFFIGIIFTIFFCVSSDILLPFMGLWILGYSIPLHICFFDYHDTMIISCFVFLSLLAGYALHKGNKRDSEKIKSYIHFFHVFFSAISALLYIVSHTSSMWIDNSGIIILLLFICVLIPCTISDFLLPLLYTYLSVKKNNVYLKRS